MPLLREGVGWGMEAEMTVPSSSHSAFKRKGLVLGVLAPGQTIRCTCPSQAPPGL